MVVFISQWSTLSVIHPIERTRSFSVIRAAWVERNWCTSECIYKQQTQQIAKCKSASSALSGHVCTKNSHKISGQHIILIYIPIFSINRVCILLIRVRDKQQTLVPIIHHKIFSICIFITDYDEQLFSSSGFDSDLRWLHKTKRTARARTAGETWV